jgi:hypothetical protein
MGDTKCATCTTLRRKIRDLQAQVKKLAKKAETPSEREARIKKVRASFTKARAKRAQKGQE